jgi:hypothetical protein
MNNLLSQKTFINVTGYQQQVIDRMAGLELREAQIEQIETSRIFNLAGQSTCYGVLSFTCGLENTMGLVFSLERDENCWAVTSNAPIESEIWEGLIAQFPCSKLSQFGTAIYLFEESALKLFVQLLRDFYGPNTPVADYADPDALEEVLSEIETTRNHLAVAAPRIPMTGWATNLWLDEDRTISVGSGTFAVFVGEDRQLYFGNIHWNEDGPEDGEEIAPEQLASRGFGDFIVPIDPPNGVCAPRNWRVYSKGSELPIRTDATAYETPEL